MKKRLLKLLGSLLLLLMMITILSAIVCRIHLKVTEYTVALDGFKKESTVVCLSDLHSLQYGQDNEKILRKVSSQNPDSVFVLGDMMNLDADSEELQQFLTLMEHLHAIAPTYFSFGNHEMDYLLNGGEHLVSLLEARDITVLWDNYVEISIGKNKVRIGGSLGHYYGYEWTEEDKANPPDYAMEESIGDSNLPAIVLLHMPETIVYDSFRKYWDADLFLSGHTHGGAIRIPGIGGLFAPTQGLFPEYDRGMFILDDRFTLIITAGLSGYGKIPRIFNLPEICVVHLTP